MEHLLSFICWFVLSILACFCIGRYYVISKQEQREQVEKFNTAYCGINNSIEKIEVNAKNYIVLRNKIMDLREMRRADQEMIDVLVAKIERKFGKS